jgi:hypothetical protein
VVSCSRGGLLGSGGLADSAVLTVDAVMGTTAGSCPAGACEIIALCSRGGLLGPGGLLVLDFAVVLVGVVLGTADEGRGSVDACELAVPCSPRELL